MVIFEDLYLGENVVASHTNINDEGQTVTFGQPEIGTTATIDGEKTAQPFEQIIITDTVEYSGLTVGQEYTLKGVMMNKETGELLVIGEDEEQAQVTFAATFTPAESNGTVDVLFTFDASTLVGKSVVVFETLFQGESEITSHENIEDEGQTVTVAVKEAITVEFYSQLLRGKITSHKTGAEQVPLEGVTFGLFDVEATEFIAEDALATTETDANGRFSFEASYGSFQVMELATLPGYLSYYYYKKQCKGWGCCKRSPFYIGGNWLPMFLKEVRLYEKDILSWRCVHGRLGARNWFRTGWLSAGSHRPERYRQPF